MHTACHHCMMHRCVKQTNESMHASHTDSLVLCNLCHALRTQEHRQRHCMTVATLPSLQSVKVNEPTRELAQCIHACTHSLLLCDLYHGPDGPQIVSRQPVSDEQAPHYILVVEQELGGTVERTPPQSTSHQRCTYELVHTAPRSVKR
jgi:hypothetical protein